MAEWFLLTCKSWHVRWPLRLKMDHCSQTIVNCKFTRCRCVSVRQTLFWSRTQRLTPYNSHSRAPVSVWGMLCLRPLHSQNGLQYIWDPSRMNCKLVNSLNILASFLDFFESLLTEALGWTLLTLARTLKGCPAGFHDLYMSNSDEDLFFSFQMLSVLDMHAYMHASSCWKNNLSSLFHALTGLSLIVIKWAAIWNQDRCVWSDRVDASNCCAEAEALPRDVEPCLDSVLLKAQVLWLYV